MLSTLVLLTSVLSQKHNFEIHFDGVTTVFSWGQTNDKIYFDLDKDLNGQWKHIHSMNFTSDVTNHTMLLEPYTDFRACINAYNDTWSSDPECLFFTVSSGTSIESVVDVVIIDTTMVHAWWNVDEKPYVISLTNSTDVITFETNNSFMLFSDLSPNTEYVLMVNGNTSVNWRMPLGAPPVPNAPKVNSSKDEIWVTLVPVSDDNGYVGHYILHVNSYQSNTDKDFHIYLNRFTENITIKMSEYLNLNNETSYSFVIEAMNGALLNTYSESSECVRLSGGNPECNADNQSKHKRVRASFVVAIMTLVFVGIIIVSSVGMCIKAKFTSTETENTNAPTTFSNPMYDASSIDNNVSSDIYEDEISMDSNSTIDNVGNYDLSGYLDIEGEDV